jgi:hypothetical protein
VTEQRFLNFGLLAKIRVGIFSISNKSDVHSNISTVHYTYVPSAHSMTDLT